MITIEDFRNLSNEDKRLLIEKLLLPILEKEKDGMKNLELFVFGSTDEELVEFYDVLLNPEKISGYIDAKGTQIKQLGAELVNLRNQFVCAKNDMNESIEKQNVDDILQNI